MISRMMLIHGAAPILAPLIGGLLLGLFGWRAIFWFLGLYGVLCVAGVTVFLPETRPAHTKGPTGVISALKGFASVLSHRRFVGYALTRAFASAGMFSYIAGSPFVFITLHGVSPQHFGFLFGLNAFGLIAASQINVRLLRRHKSERILRTTVVVMALSGVLLVTAASLPLSLGIAGFIALLLPLFFCVACNGLINPNATALAMAPFGDRAGTASALIGALTFLIAGIASAVVSALHGESALPMALTIAAVELLSLLCYVFVARPVAAQAEPPATAG